jgi:hypothetical protein
MCDEQCTHAKIKIASACYIHTVFVNVELDHRNPSATVR